MAWIRWRQTKDGRRLASVQWRDEHGRVRSKATKTSDPRLIEMHLRQAAKLEGKRSNTRIRSEDGLELLEEFLEEKALSVRPATLDVYRGKLQPLFACWAGTRPGEWTRAMFVQYAKARKWGPRTLEMAVGCCRRFIAWAHEQDIPVGDFIGSFKGPPVRTREHTPLTPKQIARLLEVARGHALEVPIALAALAGLSQADLYSIEWSDVEPPKSVSANRERRAVSSYMHSVQVPRTATVDLPPVACP